MLLWLVWVLMMGQVVYKDREVIISNPTDFPEVGDAGLRVKEVHEPVVKASIIVPEGMSCHLENVSSAFLTILSRLLW
jgi:translation elongation factor EF-4